MIRLAFAIAAVALLVPVEGAARDLERRSEDGRTRTTVIVRIAATEAHAPTTRRVTRGVA
jgi:hypothetical protein